jgi:hypothetical protein
LDSAPWIWISCGGSRPCAANGSTGWSCSWNRSTAPC